MTVRLPSARPRLFGPPEIAHLKIALELHDRADCDLPDCPAGRFREFLAELERTLAELGDDTRAQVWASLLAAPQKLRRNQ